MSYGIEVRNSGNFVKIDDETEQLVIIDSGEIGQGNFYNSNLQMHVLLAKPFRVLISSMGASEGKWFMLEEMHAGLWIFGDPVPGVQSWYFNFALFEVGVTPAPAPPLSIISRARFSHHCKYIILSRLSDVSPIIRQPDSYGLKVFNSAGDTVFTSSEKMFEIESLTKVAKADFMGIKVASTITPAQGERGYIDATNFTKTHWGQGFGETFTLTLGSMTGSGSSILIQGVQGAQQFSTNTNRTDPGMIAQTFLSGRSSING